MDKKKIKIPVPKTRRTWKINPVTRIKSSDKTYDRRRQKAEHRETLPQPREDTLPGGRKREAGFRFCPKCGASLALKKINDRKRLVCSGCGFIFYRNPVPAVAAIIPNGEKIVLVRRAEEPLRGHWCLPSGFMELNETPAECAVREVKEETGLNIRVKELCGANIARDDPRTQVVLIIFLAEMVGGELQAGDDASEAGLFGPGDLPGNIAFATHRRAIAEYFGGVNEQNSGS